MYAAAPRVDRRFMTALRGLDDRSVPMADTYRRARDIAAQMGIPRPSYERVRQALHDERRRARNTSQARELVLDLMFNTRPADTVLADLLGLLD